MFSIYTDIDSNLIEINALDTIIDGVKRKGKFTVMLRKNETYNFFAYTNFGGSTIKSINPNKTFGVVNSEFPEYTFYKNKVHFWADAHVFEVLQPNRFHGKKFYISQIFIDEGNSDYREIVRFISPTDGTISLNGRTKSLKANKADTFYIHQPSVLESTEAIQIQQLTPPSSFYLKNGFPYTNSLRNIIPWKLNLKQLNINFWCESNINKGWIYSEFNLIYPKQDRKKIRINGIRLDSMEFTFQRRYKPFPYDTSMEICGAGLYANQNFKRANITTTGSGFLADVFQNQEGFRLSTYNPGFLNKALDLEMRINGTDYFYENENNVPKICHQPTLFNCQTNYPADAWLWRIEDSTYTIQSINHSFKDTGIKKITMVSIRKDPNSTAQIADTLIKYIRIYTAPFVKFSTDTLTLSGQCGKFKTCQICR